MFNFFTGSTKITGIFGYPVKQSLSPLMHNAAYRELNLDFCYVPFKVKPADLKEAIKALFHLNLVGVNITVPHKSTVMPYLDEVDREAEMIGAVNTVVVKNRRLLGYNTDGRGFLRSLEESGLEPRGKSFLVLGTGGAGRAVAFSLQWAGAARIFLGNRTPARAVDLAGELREQGKAKIQVLSLDDHDLPGITSECDGVIHASPVGMYPYAQAEPLINPRWLKKDAVVCDLVYNPQETVLLRGAKERGCRIVPGIGMLVHQGALAFKYWTGCKPPVDLMRQVVSSYLSAN